MSKVSVVIPVGHGRRTNLRMVLDCLKRQTARKSISRLVLVLDSVNDELELPEDYPISTSVLRLEKHQPGMEQPRNAGVRALAELGDPATHVWFLDSDVIVEEDCLAEFLDTLDDTPEDQILVGPYDWLPPGVREPVHQLHNDPRWESFNRHDPSEAVIGDLSAGLACFSGNLIWPIEQFKKTGGFWNELHHGRCEDGELGLRAVAMGIPISFVAEARGWHLHHDRNIGWIETANARDVPMLNDRHPWVQQAGMFVVEEDGKRFDVRCPCGWTGNTALIWQHQADCDECKAAGYLQVDA